MAYRLRLQHLLLLLFFLPFGISSARVALVHEIPSQERPPALHVGDCIGNGKLDPRHGRERAELSVRPAVEPPSSAVQPPIVGGDSGDLLPSLPHARYYPPPGGGSSLAAPPSASPSSDGGGIAFISSNPAISLPAGESDSAAARHLPDSGKGNNVNGRGIGVKVALWAALVVPLTLWSL